MEYTGHYHYPVLKKLQSEGFPVCLINPYQMKKYGDVEIHKAKTDKKDAARIAAYALEKAYKLEPYTAMEQKYEDLRFLSRQYGQRISISFPFVSSARKTEGVFISRIVSSYSSRKLLSGSPDRV